MSAIRPVIAPRLAAISSDVDVAIIGAGAAGIAAARRCLELGLTCAVLEARDRIGGRCVTASIAGHPIDLGAHWLHAGTVNPLVKLGRERGEPLSRAHPTGILLVDGKPAGEATAREHRQAFEKVAAAIADVAAGSRDESIAAIMPELGRWRIPTEATFALISGRPLSEVSARDFPSEEFGDNWFVEGGYGAYLARLADGLPIAIGQPVRSIDWSERGVRIEAPGGRIQARAVILTVPVPLLRHIRFTPDLPDRAWDAVDDFLPGTYDHIVLDWSGSPFRESDRLAKIIGTASSYGLMTRLDGGSLHYLEIDHATAEAHRRDPKALAAFARDWLADELGEEAVDGMAVACVTNWYGEPWSRTAWMVVPPGRIAVRGIIAEPIGERIWIAGEATSKHMWGTVGGAWEEGERAASAISTHLLRQSAVQRQA